MAILQNISDRDDLNCMPVEQDIKSVIKSKLTSRFDTYIIRKLIIPLIDKGEWKVKCV